MHMLSGAAPSDDERGILPVRDQVDESYDKAPTAAFSADLHRAGKTWKKGITWTMPGRAGALSTIRDKYQGPRANTLRESGSRGGFPSGYREGPVIPGFRSLGMALWVSEGSKRRNSRGSRLT